jgi:hypothetical protein
VIFVQITRRIWKQTLVGVVRVPALFADRTFAVAKRFDYAFADSLLVAVAAEVSVLAAVG